MGKYVAYKGRKGIVFITTKGDEDRFLRHALANNLDYDPTDRFEIDDSYVCVIPGVSELSSEVN